jgi:FtsH-binding integral membrane protein
VYTCTVTAQNAVPLTGAPSAASNSFTVAIPQTISFTAPASGNVGASATLVATGGASGNPVVFSVDTTSGAGVCKVSGTNGSKVSYMRVGSCVVDANQAGGTDYLPAPKVRQTISVGVAQSITFAPLANKTMAQSPVTLHATASSGLVVAFTTTTASVCTVSGTTVTLKSSGTCSVTAAQAGNATYSPATSVTRSFKVT